MIKFLRSKPWWWHVCWVLTILWLGLYATGHAIRFQVCWGSCW